MEESTVFEERANKKDGTMSIERAVRLERTL